MELITGLPEVRGYGGELEFPEFREMWVGGRVGVCWVVKTSSLNSTRWDDKINYCWSSREGRVLTGASHEPLRVLTKAETILARNDVPLSHVPSNGKSTLVGDQI